jgi:fibronectin-binding autotransporter adhesin
MSLPFARLAAVAAIAATLVIPRQAPAQTSTWTGGAGNGNWSSPGNWNTPPPNQGGSAVQIILAGTTQTATIQDLPQPPASPPFQLNQLVIDNTATNGFSVSGNQIQFAGATPQLNHNASAAVSISAPIDFATTTTAINIANNSSATYDLILSGPLSGSGTVTASMPTLGTIMLVNGANNPFSGMVSLQSGILELGAPNALGRTTSVNTGSSLNTLTNFTRANSQGVPVGGFAQALGNVTGSGTVAVGNTANSGAYLIGFRPGDFTFGGVFTGANTSSHLAKVGTNTMTLTGNSTAYRGSTSVRDGMLTFQGGGALTNSVALGTVTVYNGATLLLDNTGTNNNNRLGDNAPVAMAGGTFRIMGNSSAATTETVGALSAPSGQSTVTVANAAQGTTLTFASGTGGLGTVFFQGPSLGQPIGGGVGNIRFTTTPTLIGGGQPSGPGTSILPWGLGSTTNGVTPDTLVTVGANGVRPLGLSDTTTFATAAPTDNVQQSASATVGPATVNAVITTGTNQTITLAGPLTVTSGALLNTGTATFSGGQQLLFGSAGGATAYVTSTTTSSSLTFATPVTAANLVKSGSGTLTVQSPVSLGANGTVAVNAGTLAINNAGGFTVASGTLTYPVSKGATLDVTASGLTVGTSQVLTGNGTVTGPLTIANGGTIAPSALGGPSASLASPGTLTVGNLALQGGGAYTWSLNSVTADPDTQSLLNVTGTLDLSGLSAGNRFTIRLQSLQPDNSPGSVYDFNPSTGYTWTIAMLTGSPAGFNSNLFSVNTSQFTNSLAGGMFMVTQAGNLLQLQFTPAPEPAGILFLALLTGAGVQTARTWRRAARRR